MNHVGLDVHERLTAVHILDANGKKSKSFTYKGHWTGVVTQLKQVPAPFAVCFEASTGYGYLYDALSGISLAGIEVGRTRYVLLAYGVVFAAGMGFIIFTRRPLKMLQQFF